MAARSKAGGDDQRPEEELRGGELEAGATISSESSASPDHPGVPRDGPEPGRSSEASAAAEQELANRVSQEPELPASSGPNDMPAPVIQVFLPSPVSPDVAQVPALPPEIAALSAALNGPPPVPGVVEGRTKPRHRDIDPVARNLDNRDVIVYILSSRYRTISLTLVLLACAVLVAAIAVAILLVGSHSRSEFIFTLTSAGTAGISAGVYGMAARRRRRAQGQPRTIVSLPPEGDRPDPGA